MSELSHRDFAAYFEAVHGKGPFPWQQRLLEMVVERGRWPDLLDLPTGSGKTATIDVALFHLALDAGREPAERVAPRRIVLVVDRRTVVDQAYERARTIAAALANRADGVVARVRDRLRSLTGAETPLALAQLRGGMPRDDAWARWPDQPLVAVSTVDQVGSRLLFRGYGVSEAMRPLHAGLLGNDVLLLLDEVHLSEPFRQTLASIARYRGEARGAGLPDRWQVVELSATPGKAGDFALNAEDRADAVLARRLAARKPIELDEKKVGGVESARRATFVDACVEHATRLAGRGRAVGVVVNRVATARAIVAALRGRAGGNAGGKGPLEGAEILLVTGRMRPLDRDDRNEELRRRVGSDRERDAAARPVVVVATQCIEAGADFDFDAVVTECASLDALRQRFGRLDRLGLAAGARGVVVVRSDALAQDADDPIYGDRLRETWRWLAEGARDFGIDAMQPAIDALAGRVVEEAPERRTALEGLLAPKRNAPVMLPAHLDLWAQTRPAPEPDPDVALWLHGIGERQAPEVQIVWRADVSEALLETAGAKDGPARHRAYEGLLARVQVCPPSGIEAMSVPLFAARAWLRGEEAPDAADVEADPRSPKEREREDESRDKEPRRRRLALLWRGDESHVIDADSRELRPGSTLVVPSTYGGLAGGTWDPTCKDPVADLGDRARWQQTRRPVLRLHAEVLGDAAWARAPAADETDDPDAEDRAAVRGVVEAADEIAAALEGYRWLPEARIALEPKGRGGPEIVRIESVLMEGGGGAPREEPGYLAVVARKRVQDERALGMVSSDGTTEDDGGSHTGVEVSLRDHLDGVASFAKTFVERCGLPARVARSVTVAAEWHDAGKADVRFQRLLRGGEDGRATVGEPIAKSRLVAADRSARARAAQRSGYPRGARHELSSVALMSGRPELWSQDVDPDLVLHLVASHHGWCRPFAPVVEDTAPVEIGFRTGSETLHASSKHGLERLDSGVAERFWRLVERYGWYGLAWLEAILRLADHRRSEWEQDAGGRGKEGR